MIIIIIVGVTIIIAICIVTIIIRCRCMNSSQSAQENYPHFDENSIPPNYGYASSKAHQKSSWACTFKGGQQENTHIWETPLPEPHEEEYTLPASIKNSSIQTMLQMFRDTHFYLMCRIHRCLMAQNQIIRCH